MTDTHVYVVTGRTLVRSVGAQTDARMCITSPVPLERDGIRDVLFEKWAQAEVFPRTRDWRLFCEQEIRPIVQDQDFYQRYVLKNLGGIASFVTVYQHGERHATTRFIAEVKEVDGAYKAPWTIRYRPGLIEAMLGPSSYLPLFDDFWFDDKDAFLTDVILFRQSGGHARRTARGIEVALARAKEGGIAHDQLRELEGRLVAELRGRHELQRRFADVFSDDELIEMGRCLAKKPQSQAVPLAVLVQHTSTLYIPDTIRSYGLQKS